MAKHVPQAHRIASQPERIILLHVLSLYPQAWNKWFTKGPGRARARAIRPRHPQAPPGLPPAGLRPPAEYVPPPPPPPVFSMANLRRQKKLAKWRVRGTGLDSTVVPKSSLLFPFFRVLCSMRFPKELLRQQSPRCGALCELHGC